MFEHLVDQCLAMAALYEADIPRARSREERAYAVATRDYWFAKAMALDAKIARQRKQAQ